jgi:ankyrin repeat protein
MMAVARGDMTTLQRLIDLGIDLNQANNEGITPVMLAASQVTTAFLCHLDAGYFISFRIFDITDLT